MLILISEHGPVLVDADRLPRYWASAWTLLHGADLAPSTLKRKLGYIEAFYAHTESLGGNLDDALADLDLTLLGNTLEAFFVLLRNVPRPTGTTAKRWTTAFQLVRDTCLRLEKNPAVGRKLADVQAHISRLDNLYLGLRPFRIRYGRKPRAIPRAVVAELLEVVQPEHPKNPFLEPETKWRVYVLVSLLLLQGMRLGESSPCVRLVVASLFTRMIRAKATQHAKESTFARVHRAGIEQGPHARLAHLGSSGH